MNSEQVPCTDFRHRRPSSSSSSSSSSLSSSSSSSYSALFKGSGGTGLAGAAGAAAAVALVIRAQQGAASTLFNNWTIRSSLKDGLKGVCASRKLWLIDNY